MSRANPTACYRELGVELRKRRKAAGLNIAEMSDRVGWERSKISRIESGQNAIDFGDVLLYLGHCGIYGPDTRDLVALCEDAERNLGYWLSPQGLWLEDSLRSLIYHEAAADTSTFYQPQLVHGLLQTADYARARIGAERWRSKEDVARCVQVRMHRQHVLNAPGPASFTFFLHEHALHLEVGSPAVMQAQMLKIVLLAALSNVTVRVVESSMREPFAFGGPFHLLESKQCPPLVYLDNHATGLFLEDPAYVEPYSALASSIAEVAMDEGQSRELIATLAYEYDLGSARDAGNGVEEEQPE